MRAGEAKMRRDCRLGDRRQRADVINVGVETCGVVSTNDSVREQGVQECMHSRFVS